jgi:hypothetical protein
MYYGDLLKRKAKDDCVEQLKFLVAEFHSLNLEIGSLVMKTISSKMEQMPNEFKQLEIRRAKKQIIEQKIKDISIKG